MKWHREPLAHFLLLGAALFAVFALWGGPAASAPGQYHIVITPTMAQNLVLGFQRSHQRAPTAQETDALIAGFVREEILVREAHALNLDQDDMIVRNELRGKMEYFLGGDPVPTDAQLADYLQKNPDTFRQPDGSLPALAEVRANVAAAWQTDQRRANVNAAYDELRKHYVVEVPKEAPPPAPVPAAAANTGTP